MIQISKNFDIKTSNYFDKKNRVDKVDFFFQFVNLTQISRKNTTFIAMKKMLQNEFNEFIEKIQFKISIIERKATSSSNFVTKQEKRKAM